MNSYHRLWILSSLALLAGGCTGSGLAREKSVKPGINDSFKGDVDVSKYEARFEGESREVYKHRQEILDATGLKPGMRIADIGAGTGFFTMLFAERTGAEGGAVAVDIAPNFISHIDKQAKERGLKNVETVLCKEDSVELPDGSVDLVFICDTYHHFEYPRSTLASIYSALRPGGEMVIVDFFRTEENIEHLPSDRQDWIRGHVRADRDEVTKEIEAAGFQALLDGPKTPYLTENYMTRFRKPH